MSKRKQHNGDAGYVAERMNPNPNVRRKVVIYMASEAGIDTYGLARFEKTSPYAIVCDAHSQIGAADTMQKARGMMKNPADFCTGCRELDASE